jgi:outer membrane receptor protein involved in Fe transport
MNEAGRGTMKFITVDFNGKEFAMRGKLFVMLCVLVVTPLVLFGGTTGKIKGRITDKQTGEPLVGATAIVVGTSLGAAANVDGEFIILNVVAGTYELEAKFLGYQPLRFNNVQINADLTTELTFPLTALSGGVAMPEIVIQMERDLINKNATNAVRIQTGEDVKNLPIRGVQAAVALNPGVVFQDNNIYIRGGREGEVGYYLEGASTRNVMDGTNLTTVIPEALEEFQIQAGGYTAQYGGANSGIVRQTLKSGTRDLKASLMAETDNFTPQYKQALGTYSYGYSNYVATLSGPIYGDKIKFFVAGENRFDRDYRVQFWDGFTETNLADRQSSDPVTGIPRDTLALLEIKSGNQPGNLRNRYTGNGTITFDFNPIIVRLGGAITWQRQRGTSSNLAAQTTNSGGDLELGIFDFVRLPITETSNSLFNVKLDHFVSPTMLYELNFSYGDNRQKRNDPDYGDAFLLYNDSLANSQHGYQYRTYVNGPQPYNFAGFYFTKYGAAQTGFLKNRQQRYGGNLDFTAQLGGLHEVKAGGSVDAYIIRNFTTGSAGLLNWYRQNPDQARTPGTLRDYYVRRNGGVNNYGYDVYGNEITDAGDINGPRQPVYWGAYIQDKIEYNDLVVNAGIRLDIFDNDDIKFIDDPTTPTIIEGPDNPSVDANTFEYKATGIQKVKPFKALSPRLGFAFPVSDRTVFHVQFVKLIQSPSLNQLYIGRGSQGVNWSGGNFIPSPVGFDLDPERTTSYEVGFTQQFSDVAAFDISAYYRDIKGQIQVIRQITTVNSIAKGYNTLANGDFATTRGFELSFRLRRTNRIQAQANYTFASALGTGSTGNSFVGSVENGTQLPTIISPLDFNQVHRGAINFDYRFGENDGGPILERLGLNLLFTFNSGHPYTLSQGSIGQQGAGTGALVENDPRSRNPLEAIGASTTPWNFSIDMRLNKALSVGPLTADFYIYVQNLLNTRNVLNVYGRTGNADNDGFLDNPNLSGAIINSYGPRYVDLYNKINIANGAAYRFVTGNDLWGTPRQIRFGLKLEY